MTTITRRVLLGGVARGLLGSVAAVALAACSQRVAAPTVVTASPVPATVARGDGPNATDTRTVAAATVTPRSVLSPRAAATAGQISMWDLLPQPDCRGVGSGRPYGVTPNPSDPFGGGFAAEGAAIAFEERVRRYADLIVLVEERTFLPARWNTPDGQQPANPHQRDLGYTIITPEWSKVITVAKGRYDLPALYLAHYGGRIGQDCVRSSNSLLLPVGPIGTQFLYLLKPYERDDVIPAESDQRYRFYSISRIYPVSPDGTITIGPESDITNNRKDDPPRTLTVNEALAEIAALTANSATPAPTPTPR